MRIGIVSYWFNRGQAVVSRHVRSILTSLGHETYVLARRTRESFVRPGFVDRDGPWDQPDITEGSAYDMDAQEYLRWAERTGVEVVFFDQNLQFEEIAALRARGVRTIGRFVWESFAPDDVMDALQAFDCIYSLTRCEQARYRRLGIESPYVPWGCHPELLAVEAPPRHDDTVRFFYPGGYLSKRKPTDAVLEAFLAVDDPRARLVLKIQDEAQGRELAGQARSRDPRIEVIVGDLPAEAHLRLFAGCDVSLAPSRWEGLGLHLYEAVAFGLPTITNDAPPMNEMVAHGVDGWLVPGSTVGYTPRSCARPRRKPGRLRRRAEGLKLWLRSRLETESSTETAAPSATEAGVPIVEPDAGALADAIRALCNEELRQRLRDGVARRREQRAWSHTVAGYHGLLSEVAATEAAQ